MPDINGLRLSPTLPSVHFSIDQNAGRIVEPPTWRVRPLSPLANSDEFIIGGDDDDDGGEEEQGGWEWGEGEYRNEDTHENGEEDEGDDEGDGIDNDRDGDGGRWASLV